MKISTALRATQGLAIPGLSIVHSTLDDVRKLTVYIDDQGDMVVGFGGTRPSFWDILLDLLAFTVPFHGYQGHAGAVAETLALMADVMTQARIYQPKRITLAGHSQGGAHAVLMAIPLAERWPGVEIDVFTFGGLPALSLSSAHRFDLALANGFNVQVTNYLLSGDPMGVVPWWLVGLGRVGQTVRLQPRLCWPSVRRHDPAQYLAALEAIEEKGATP